MADTQPGKAGKKTSELMDKWREVPGCDVVCELLSTPLQRKRPREAKIAKLELVASGVNQEVLGLDVSVNHAVVVTPVYRSA